jgi:hypothetical protein
VSMTPSAIPPNTPLSTLSILQSQPPLGAYNPARLNLAIFNCNCHS